MRYWIKLHEKITGPIDVEQLPLIAGMGPHALLCPERSDPKDYRNWDLARSYPDVQEALSKPRAARPQVALDEPPVRAPEPPPNLEWTNAAVPAQFPWLPISILVGGTIGIMIWRGLPQIGRVIPPPPPSHEKVLESVTRVPIPACRSTLGDVLGPPEITLGDGGQYTVSWTSPKKKGEIKMAYSPDGQLRALTPAAAEMLNMDSPCAK